MYAVLILSGIVVTALLLLYFTRRQQRLQEDGRFTPLRPLPAYADLSTQLGEAIEAGKPLHISLGQAGLAGAAAPTSVAAVHVLDRLAQEGCASGSPPLTTVGEGTLLPIAQDSLRRAYADTGRLSDYKPTMSQFVAADTDRYVFAGGVGSVIQQNKAGGNVMVGRYGPEIVIAAEAASRQKINQVIGTDDPSALAAATAVTDKLLVGEELFAAGAYLEGSPSQIAGLQVQDILRAVIAVAILLLAIIQFLTG